MAIKPALLHDNTNGGIISDNYPTITYSQQSQD
mgnify:CR=1 FL=1